MADRILIVDDEVDMVSLLAFSFSQAGFAVATAADGNEAFEKARMFLPDAVVMDVRMPVMDGFEVCRLLQQVPATRSIPVLIISGHGNEQTPAESRSHGAVDYLPKPFSPRELVSRVQSALSRSRDDGN
jgi:DNA-binding response OmpR family regulator